MDSVLTKVLSGPFRQLKVWVLLSIGKDWIISLVPKPGIINRFSTGVRQENNDFLQRAPGNPQMLINCMNPPISNVTGCESFV
jgi:hypothetical protein